MIGDGGHVVDAQLSARAELAGALGGDGTGKSEDGEGLHFGVCKRRC